MEASVMYAHVNTWQLNETGATVNDTVAQALATQLIEQPGFHAYTLVRTDTQEVVALMRANGFSRLHSFPRRDAHDDVPHPMLTLEPASVNQIVAEKEYDDKRQATPSWAGSAFLCRKR
jgi:hypothetical protein